MTTPHAHSPAEIDRAADLLARLIAIPSVNPAIGAAPEVSGEERLVSFLTDWARTRGLSPEAMPVAAGRRNLLIRLAGQRQDAPTVAYVAHLDTVWTPAMSNPFVARRDGDHLHGLGACDNKGGIAVGMLLAEAFAARPPKHRLVLCFTSDEEAGFTGIRALVPDVLRPDAAIIAEPTGLNPVTSHKGLARWSIVTLGESVHASLIPKGRNAIFPAARLVAAAERHLADLLKRRPDPRLGPPTLNIGMIQGGSQDNSVPDRCEIRAERRLIPGETIGEAAAELQAALRSTGEAFSFHTRFEAPPFAIPDGHSWPAAILAASRRHAPAASFAAMPCATEAAHLGLHNIPAVVFGPGRLAAAHAKDESVPLGEVLAARDILLTALA